MAAIILVATVLVATVLVATIAIVTDAAAPTRGATHGATHGQPGVQPGLQPGLQQPGAAPSSQLPWPVPSWPQQGSPQVYEQPAYPQAIGAQPPYPQHGYTPSPYPPSPYPPTAYPQPAYAPAGYSQVGYPPQAVAPAPPYPGPSPEASGYPQGGEQQGRRGPAVGAQVVEAAPAEPRNSVHTASAGPSALAYEIGQREERRSPAWRAIKWPLRHLIKGVYLTGNAAKNHRKAAIALTLIVLLLVIGAGAIYGYTHPSAPPDIGPAAVGAGSAAQDNTTPFTVVTGAQPPLAPGVLEWLHAYKTFNGYELWDSLSPTFQGQLSQAGVKSDQLQQSLLQEKSQGVGFDEFIYTGGYLSPDGLSHFTVEAVETQGDRKAILTWFFMTDSTGKIVIFHDLTPATQG